MTIAALEALKSNPFPNPKVGAALFDKNMNLKNKSFHVQKGLDHAEVSLIKDANCDISRALPLSNIQSALIFVASLISLGPGAMTAL